MKSKLLREVRLLKVYAIVATLICGAFMIAVITLQKRRPKFSEIDVERINIVEKDGKLKLVISNKDRLPDNVVAGKILTRHERSPGILFYNEEGDECGGLTFDGQKKKGGIEAFSALTFDQYQQDQTLELVYNDSPGYRLVGMKIKDRPEISLPEHARRLEEASKMSESPERVEVMKPLLAPDRVFVGKSNGNAAIWLFAADGKPRIKMVVDGPGNPKLQFLDATGKVIYALPDGPNPTTPSPP
jgi:hypothetical protein